MASSYAFPINGHTTHPQVDSHTRSHHRRAAPEPIPTIPTSTVGAYQMSVESPRKENGSRDEFGHMYSHSVPHDSWKDSEHRPSEHHHVHTHSQFPQVFETSNPASSGFASQGQRMRRSDSQNRAQNRGYGFPDIQVQSNGSVVGDQGGDLRSSSAMVELMSAIMIPLPYILTTLILGIRSQRPAPESSLAKLIKPGSEVLSNLRILDNTHTLNILITCALTSVTLLGVGTIGKLRGTTTVLDRRKRGMSSLERGNARKHKSSANLTLENTRRIGGRILAIGLPFYATMLIGGERVAMLVLLAAVGAFNINPGQNLRLTYIKGFEHLLDQRIWTLTVLAIQFVSDVIGITTSTEVGTTIIGYVILAISLLAIPPPYAMAQPKASNITEPMSNSARKTSTVATPWEAPPINTIPSNPVNIQSPLIATAKDTNLTLCAGFLTACVPFVMASLPFHIPALISYENIGWILLASCAAVLSLLCADQESMQEKKKYGLVIGLVLPVVMQEIFQPRALWVFALQGFFVACFLIALGRDTHSASLHSPHSHLHHKRHELHDSHSVSSHRHGPHSRFTGALLHATHHWPLIHGIIVEKDSRRILYFMCLNFAFMLVQTFYALVTGSLGLLSDSIHMLFDCLALVVGLCAAVMSKWPPSVRFPYGFSKMDSLAGFANGIFLMLISIEIVYEAVERLVEGSEMQRIGELLTVSSLGLLVNLVGMFAFGHAHHGHGHSHGGHDHSHEKHDHSHHHANDSHNHVHEAHSHEEHSHSNHSPHAHPDTTPDLLVPSKKPNTSGAAVNYSKSSPAHDHAHVHSHSHSNENMHGIFLHVLADTLGSVAVVISTILVHYTQWAGFDPLASCIIAILIFASAIPLVSSSAKRLLLAVPAAAEFDLREVLAGVGILRGVAGVNVPRFWLVGEGDDEHLKGVMHVLAEHGERTEDVRARAEWFLQSRGIDCLVQVERVGEERCWCGGSAGAGNGGK